MEEWAEADKITNTFLAHMVQRTTKVMTTGKESWICAVNTIFLYPTHSLTTEIPNVTIV